MLMFKGLLAVALLVCLAPAGAQSMKPRPVPVAPDSDRVQGLSALDSSANRNVISNAGFVVTPDGVLLVDALGSPTLTRDDLAYLCRSMCEAARNMDPFDEAHARTDGSRFDQLPLFGPANRINAYNTCLLMERGAR